MLWVFAADCLKLMIGFCNDDFGFFDWFLGGGRSSNSVVIFGGTCKKWTCSTMTSWRKSIEYEEHLFLLLLLKLLFYLIRSEDLGTASLSTSTFKKTDRFWVQSVSYYALFVCFRSCFFFCSTHAFRSASQSSRSAAAEATAQRSPQVIFLGIHTAKYSVMSTWIAAVLELNQLNAERKGWDCQQLTPHCKKKRKNRRLNTKLILPFSQAKQ